MEHLWNDRQHVRLRSREHGAYYLHADDDGVGVSLHDRRASLNTAWAVHVYHNGEGIYVLLHSAAYGGYLAATARRAPLGHRGFRAAQRDYDQPEVQAIMWQVIGAGFPSAVVLRNVGGGGRYLRANGKYLLWNRGVTVEAVADDISTMMHWIVEPIPSNNGMQPISDRLFNVRLPDDFSVVVLRLSPAPLRVIRYVLASDDGHYTEEGWSELHYRGRSVYLLRNELARRLNRCFLDLVMCVRAGRYGRLTPLGESLPRHRHEVTMEIVIFMHRTPGANAQRHPDIYFLE